MTHSILNLSSSVAGSQGRWSVLGSGVAGLCVATLLAERGEAVEIITQPDCRAASHWAGGMLAPWCEAESAPPEVIEWGQHAAGWWAKRVDGVVQQGTLVVAPPRDSRELTRFASMTQQHQWVAPGDVEPALENRFARGLFFAREAHLDPRRALQQLQDTLKEAGVPFHSGQPGGKIIDCRGIHAADQQPALRAVRGEMVILHTPDICLSRPVRLLHPRFPCYLVPRANGHFMLGATMVESHDSSPISAKAMMELLSAAYSLHPALAEARIVESGTGLRPAYRQNLPEVRYENGRFSLNGLYRHGFLLAPIMAENLMRRLTQETPHAN
ncbi:MULTISPECIES: FAD-dependent oxidoreductase [Pantoea]|uniref:FAD-dependent oxidoreductase n=1 Tax=Pantoea TaxID=53335 RepID=UPI001627183A|nr:MULTISPECIES: FAD-dependent oxidoreductase [Pantoea]KAF6666663.1 FAD-dependent oxidoreductase [Pantoea sp. EKM101V]MEB5705915.1 FAD-dependent oxidoreductase [Pantoea anthophila]MEB6516750.1 FAD-dependent oxidoreductase [Pantoea anthophila]